jgi:murein DD-endopeptidase MepM/ murein hydrolase activator NlpD
MSMDRYDRGFQRAISAPIKFGGNLLKGLLKKKLLALALKALVAVGKALLVALKALIAALGIPGLIILAIIVLVGAFYVLLTSPVSLAEELWRLRDGTQYEGEFLSVYLDVHEDWDKDLDQEALELYAQFENKCIKDQGFTDFQKLQAHQYVLPFSLIMGIERMELFAWDDDFIELRGQDRWTPLPDEVYEELRTHYEWMDSEIVYRADIQYSYEYSYKWDEYIPPVRCYQTGIIIEEEKWVTREESGSASNVQEEFVYPFDIKLLTEADAFDNVYALEYEDYQTKKGLLEGSLSLRYGGAGERVDGAYTMVRDSIAIEKDEHEQCLFNIDFYEAVSEDVSSIRDSVRNSFRSDAYDINFNFDYQVVNADKEYRPLESITKKGVQFARLHAFLEERFDRRVDPLDIEIIFAIAKDYDPRFAYNFSANHGELHFGRVLDYRYNEIFGGDLVWPVSAEGWRITSDFGYRGAVRCPDTGAVVSDAGFHGGVDIGGTGHTPIHSAADGVVVCAGVLGSLSSGYGRTVIVDHGDDPQGRNIRTLYAHLEDIYVRPKQGVSASDEIGLMGSTGSSTGVHLHFEVIIDNKRVNPLMFY